MPEQTGSIACAPVFAHFHLARLVGFFTFSPCGTGHKTTCWSCLAPLGPGFCTYTAVLDGRLSSWRAVVRGRYRLHLRVRWSTPIPFLQRKVGTCQLCGRTRGPLESLITSMQADGQLLATGNSVIGNTHAEARPWVKRDTGPHAQTESMTSC